MFYFFFILFFLLLQTTLLHYAKIYGVIPNLLITLTIVTALVRSSTEGAAVGLFSGLCIDMQFGTVLGFYALLGMYAGMAAGIVSRRIYRENVLVVVPFTFVYSIIYESVVFILNNIMTGNISSYMLSQGSYCRKRFTTVRCRAAVPFACKSRQMVRRGGTCT